MHKAILHHNVRCTVHGASLYLSCSESPLVKFLVVGVESDAIELKSSRNLIIHRENSNGKKNKELTPEDPCEDL